MCCHYFDVQMVPIALPFSISLLLLYPPLPLYLVMLRISLFLTYPLFPWFPIPTLSPSPLSLGQSSFHPFIHWMGWNAWVSFSTAFLLHFIGRAPNCNHTGADLVVSKGGTFLDLIVKMPTAVKCLSISKGL